MRRRWALLTVLVLMLAIGMLIRPKDGDELPRVSITADSLTDWIDKKDVREAVLTYDDDQRGMHFSIPITIHIQGSSSRKHSKHNFTIKMAQKIEMVPGWGAHKKYCLKANYIDPTQACNIVSCRLAAQMQRAYGLFDAAPNAGLADGFPVWVTLNGTPAGLYTWNIPKDEWMFGVDKDSEQAMVMFGNSWTRDIIFQAEKVDYKKGWVLESGDLTSEKKKRFNRLYRFIRDASDEEFRANFDRYLDLDACLNYYCFCCVSFAEDNLGKNMILVTYDGEIWMPSLYDLDSLWGVSWKGTCPEESAIDVVLESKGLLRRLRDCFPDELNARYAELRGSVLSVDNIHAEFERFRDEIPQEYYDMDWEMWNPEGKYIRTYELMYELLDDYLPTVDSFFGYTSE